MKYLLPKHMLFCMVFALGGCASAINYDMKKDMYVSQKFQPYSVAVNVFRDQRPAEECNGKLSLDHKGFAYTKDSDFTPKISQQISMRFVEHLTKSKLFKQVALENVPGDILKNKNEMETLAKKGFDLLVVGNLKHFYGYQSETMPVAYLFGLSGALLEAMMNPKKVGGLAGYSEVNVIDLRKQNVIWSGEICQEFSQKDVFYDTPSVYALQTLKQANNKFVKQLESVLSEETAELALK